MFRKTLEQLPPDQDLVVTESGSLRVRDLLSGFDRIPAGLTGQKIVLYCEDICFAIRNLVLLEGIADSILLLPATTTTTDLNGLAKDFDADYVLTDKGELSIENVPDYPVIQSFDEITKSKKDSSAIQTRWVMTTSGTTGKPKLVSHSLKGLTRTSKRSLDQGNKIIWGLLYDYTRFAGLQVVLQSLLSGSKLLVPRADKTISEKIRFFIAKGITHLSGTPTLWRKLSMTPETKKMKLKQVTMGGEIADQKTLDIVKALFPDARVTHIFASTEAGVAFSVNDGKAGFPVEYLSEAPGGIEMKIENNILYVRNSEVIPRYLGSDVDFGNDNAWIETGDNVEIVDRRVRFLGRASGVINVGGDKVHPEEVEEVILQHPAVELVRVYGKDNPFSGQIVIADVILSETYPPSDDTIAQIREYAGQYLSRSKIPATFKVVDSLESSPAGKLLRT